MTTQTNELQALVTTLADSFDQIVFLERAVQHINTCETPEGLLPILEEARLMLSAQHAALSLGGQWLTPVPPWLAELATYQVPMLQPALLIPFRGGWTAFWGKAQGFGAAERKIAETLGRLMAGLYQSLELRQKQQQQALEAHEQRLASDLWRTIMLQPQTQLPAYQWQVWYEPAKEIGGDFYLMDDNWVMVGDISGKGLAAAMLSGMFQAAAKVALKQAQPFRQLEQAMLADFLKTGMFCTLFATQFLSNGELGYLNMGHPPALLIDPAGSVRSLSATTLPFGIFPTPDLELQRVQLVDQEILVILTDGVTEASQHGLLYGQERLISLLKKTTHPSQVIAKIKSELKSWQIEDDVCVLAIQYQAT